jgi:hypothetical protein
MPGLRMCIVTLVTIVQLMASPAMSQPKCDFLKIARDFIAKEYPFIDLHAAYRHPVTSESNTFWEVRYEFPPDWLVLGFVPVVLIDKRTCGVVHGHVEQ